MKFFKKSLLAIACSLAVCCVIGGVSFLGTAPMAAADDVSALVRTSYELGEVISIPSATLEYNGQTIEADSHVVYFPDGSTSKTNAFTVNDYGTYTIRYMAQVNGKKVYSDKEFFRLSFTNKCGLLDKRIPYRWNCNLLF